MQAVKRYHDLQSAKNLYYFKQGGSEILESLGYTEYNGFSLQYPRYTNTNNTPPPIPQCFFLCFQVEKSTYIARLQAGLLTNLLTGLLIWPHNRIVLENTQFEFPGFSINVPRIFQGPLSVLPTYPPNPENRCCMITTICSYFVM